MKKVISGLMIGIITSACAMTTMAAPNDHKKAPPVPHQMDKKNMPPKADPRHTNQSNHINKNDRHDKFDKQNHKAFSNKDKKQNNGPKKPLPPKNDHRR